MDADFKKVMTPLDLEHDSKRALDLATKWVQQSDGVLYLVHIVPTSEMELHRSIYRPEEGGGANPEWAETVAKERLAEIAKEISATGIKCEILTKIGEPGAEIANLIAANGIDLVILAKHRQTSRLRSWLLGSTTYQVVRQASSNILVLH